MIEQSKILGGNPNTSVGGAGLGIYNSQAKTSLRDKSTMDMAIDTLLSNICNVEMNFQNLGDKLKPIISTVDAASYAVDPIRPASCELEERILNLATRIANLNASMSDINARVCL